MAARRYVAGVNDGERRVLIVDDHRAVGEALARTIDVEPEFRCVGVETSLDGAVAAVRAQRPDVVVIDASLGEDVLVAWTEAIENEAPEAAVLVVTDDATPGLIAAAARVGASAVLRRGGPARNILAALRTPVGVGVLVDAGALATIAVPPRPAPPPATSLTERERDVLRLLGEGRDTRVIAAELGITFHTARGYVKSILQKLDSHTQLEAVVTAQRIGLLTPP